MSRLIQAGVLQRLYGLTRPECRVLSWRMELEVVMTKSQQARVKDALASYTQKATVSAQTARETLVREGIYLENGKLAPSYAKERKTA